MHGTVLPEREHFRGIAAVFFLHGGDGTVYGVREPLVTQQRGREKIVVVLGGELQCVGEIVD